MKHASLFSGIGGFDLAAAWMGWENVFQVEIDPFCNKVLEKHFPNTKRYLDVKTFDASEYWGSIDILTGGFPCQPFSSAGKRKGTNDDRYLWPEMLRIIREVKPAWIVAENVRNILVIEQGMVFERICSDLENAGYEVWPVVLPACSLNAPHRRDRVWFIAYSQEASNSGRASKVSEEDGRSVRNNLSKSGNPDRVHAANSKSVRPQRFDDRSWEAQSGRDSWEQNWPEVATEFCRVDDGVPDRVDRLESLGNAIVPQVAFQIFKSIAHAPHP